MKKDYIVTAKVGKNAAIFPDILRLYVPEKSMVLDMTWGKGAFWIGTDTTKYKLARNDIDEERGDLHHDFRHLPDIWAGIFDAVILDPPYLYIGGFKTLDSKLDSTYSNKARAAAGIYGVEAVDKMYYDGIKEAYRVLKPNGVLILKCQDQVMSGKQRWTHITYHNYADDIGFNNEDLFVVVSDHQPIMRHEPENQKHARRNHSYFMVFRKRKNENT